ncbi:MAG: sensor histidine kinase [Bacteroidota bacterium]
MKYTLSFVFFLAFLGQAKAQSQRMLDSLENIVQHTGNAQLKLKILGDLCWNYSTVNFDRALSFGQAELQLAEQLKDTASIALAYSDIGNTYTRANHLQEALSFHLKSYTLREKLGLKAKAAGSISNIAVIYKQLGKYKEALSFMHRSLKIYEEAGDESKQALVLGNIGNVYIAYKKFEPAKENYQRAIVLAKKTNATTILANAHSGLLQYYFQQNKYKDALRQAFIAEKYLKQLQAKIDLATVYNSIGQIYYEEGKLELAMKYYNNSLAIRVFMKDKLGIASCYKNMGAAYAKLKNYPLAEKYLNESILIFKEIDSKDYLREAYGLLANVFEAKNDEANALKFFKKSIAFKDSIYNKQASDKISELQIAYQTEKKAQQIVLLHKENKIQKLTLFKRNIFLGISITALLTALLIGYLLFKAMKLKQTAQLQMEVLNQQDIATKAILNAEENERKRISGELHDGLGQMFSAVKMNLSALLEDIVFENEEHNLLYKKTLNLVDESCGELRSISHQMAPNVLLKSGLATAIKDFIDKIDGRKLKINLETTDLNQRLDSNVEMVLYRVIQEAVNNVIKHAGANTLDIQLIKDIEGVKAMIEDNGKGFDASNLEKFEGIGLKNIRSRVAYLKGEVDFSSSPGQGTLVAIYIPL